MYKICSGKQKKYVSVFRAQLQRCSLVVLNLFSSTPPLSNCPVFQAPLTLRE